MTDTATRVFVNDFHKLLDRLPAITDDMTWHALRCGNEFAIDDEKPVIVALEKTLHDDVAAMLSCLGERDFNFIVRLPESGFRTTGKPIRAPARFASLELRTSRCFGTGNPRSRRILLVSSLSDASSTAILLVLPVVVAWMRCWYLP
jgi:hypothetical protein